MAMGSLRRQSKICSTSWKSQSRAGYAPGTFCNGFDWFFLSWETSLSRHRPKRRSTPRAKPWNMVEYTNLVLKLKARGPHNSSTADYDNPRLGQTFISALSRSDFRHLDQAGTSN